MHSGCREGEEIVCQDDPLDCGCNGPCAPGQHCVGGACMGGSTADCCGPGCTICEFFEDCVEGVCACAPDLTLSDPYACGCPARDCGLILDQELCINGQCVCDPALHKDNQGACGCPPVTCEEDQVCREGECVCNPPENRNNSDNCGCNGPCLQDETCISGRCICPSNAIRCGEACLPGGTACCDPVGGFSCADGHVCELAGAGWTCRASATQPCYREGLFAGSCPPGQVCETGIDGHIACRESAVVPCYDEDDRLTHVCPQGNVCIANGDCLPPGHSLCGDELTTCAPGAVCEKAAIGWQCRPGSLQACYRDGDFVGACPVGDRCIHGAGGHACVPGDVTACFDDAGVYVDFCAAGLLCLEDASCLMPGQSVCGDGVTVCQGQEACVRQGGRWGCRPLAVTPCYRGDDYVGFCPQGEVCEVGPRDHICRPANTVPCYDERGGYVQACPLGHSCYDDGHGCLPPGWSLCGDSETTCPAGEQCEDAGRLGFVCRAANMIPCYVDGAFVGACQAGEVCERTRGGGRTCRPSGTVPCYDQGRFVQFCEAGMSCGPDQTCVRPDAMVCADGRICPAGEVCERVRSGGSVCRAQGAVPCHDNGYLIGTCDSNEACEILSRHAYVCRPSNSTPCYSNMGRYETYCQSGHSCVSGICLPPGWYLCGDRTQCSSGQVCERRANETYTCRPSNVTPCYGNGGYAGFCENNDRCVNQFSHGGGGHRGCVPSNAAPCYDDGLYTGFCGAGQYCTGDNECRR